MLDLKELVKAKKTIVKNYEPIEWLKASLANASTIEAAAQFVDADTKDIGIKAVYSAMINAYNDDLFESVARVAYTYGITISDAQWQALFDASQAFEKAKEEFVAVVEEAADADAKAEAKAKY